MDKGTRSGRRSRPLYVEIDIAAPLDRVWELTQDPGLHSRWDMRFSRILPGAAAEDGSSPFVYERSLLVHTIRGRGVSLGERHSSTGARTSALLFDTEDRVSPLQEGRGYWRYLPTETGVRFITGYDYRPGGGAVGAVVDRYLTRHVIWWMTAWSFDRLRLWAELGREPEEFRWWSLLVPRGRAAVRPRARRCLSRPAEVAARSTVMADAPRTLATLRLS